MAKVRHVVRKIEPGQLVTFEDQLWPVNVALIVLAGFVAGAILAVSDFSDPRLLYNGWARMGTLVVSVGLLMWAAARLGNRRMRRAIQLATVLSMIMHVLLLVVLYNQRMARLEVPDSEVDATAPPREIVTLPDYRFEASEQTSEYLEKPVEVETPDDKPQEVQRDEAPPKETPLENMPTPVPGKEPEIEVNTVPLKDLQQAAPRRADQASRLSKQTAKAIPQPVAPVTAPKAAPDTTDAWAKVEAKIEVARKATPLPTPNRKPTPREPKASAQKQTARLSRRDVNTPDPSLSSSVSTLTRQVNEPAALPKVAAAAPENPSQAVEQESMLFSQPASKVARQQSAGPRVAMKKSAEPKSATTADVARIEAARQSQSDRPELATTPQPVASRQTQTAALPSATAFAQQQPASGPPSATDSLAVAPAASKVARTDVSALTSPPNMTAATSNLPATGISSIAGTTLARAEQASVPTLNPSAAPSARLARATNSARVEASPIAAQSPGTSQSDEPAQTAEQPQRTALSKGTVGIFGSGQEQNFDRGLTASGQPNTVASVSASRAAATQTGPSGPALTPSAPAAIAKSIAGANVPSALFRADDVEVATAVGGGQIGQLEATSSAAIQRANSNAPRGTITAGVGTGELDIGPTQVVANLGSSRAAGGGAPTVKLGTQGPSTSRSSRRGGVPAIALDTLIVAPVAEAPSGTGGGAPSAPLSASGVATTAVRTSGGGNLPTATAAGKSSPGGIGGAQVGDTIIAAGGGGGPIGSTGIARASAGSEAAPGPTASGGGAGQPVKAVGRAIASAALPGEIAQVSLGPDTGPMPAEGTPGGTGQGTGAPGDASAQGSGTGGVAAQAAGTQAVKASSLGIPGKASGEPVGALAGDAAFEAPIVGSPGTGINLRAGADGNEAAPNIGPIAAAGPVRKTTTPGTSIDAVAAISDVPNAGAPSEDEMGPLPGVNVAVGNIGTPNRRVGGLPVQVAALDGPGGLGIELSPEVGSLNRRAQRDSEVVNAGAARFLNPKVGGPLAIDGRSREPAAAFVQRSGIRLGRSGGPGQPSERTEHSVEMGLDFLARHQSPQGNWSLNKFGAGRPGYEKEHAGFQSDTAATGLALLAFFGAGYDHFDDQYKNTVRGGLDFLLKHQKANGDLYVVMDPESSRSAWFYSHGIAAIALCEAYGMTGDPALREPAQKAIDFIMASQHPTRGAWRYTPQFGSDTSVSGWQLMALKSGELAGLKILPDTYPKVKIWLAEAQVSKADGSRYVYNPLAPNTKEQSHGRKVTPSMTAVGLLMRLYLGWDRNHPEMIKGAQYLLDNLPAFGTQAKPQADTYYWYYATQVMFHMKGDYWRQWHERLHPMLADSQIQRGPMAGSWDPEGAIPDRWAAQGGRIYVTTLNLLSLEVFYRHLPIYETQAK